MSKVDIRWKLNGFRALRYQDARPLVEAAGNALAARANAQLKNGHDGFKVVSYPGARKPQGRHQVKVVAATRYARRADAKHNILVRSL